MRRRAGRRSVRMAHGCFWKLHPRHPAVLSPGSPRRNLLTDNGGTDQPVELTISRTAALTGKIAAAIRTVFKRARLLGRYRRRAAVVVISEGRPSRCHDERDRKFADSPLE